MASPYQQQVVRRKIVYLVAIVVLLTGCYVLRAGLIDPQARNLMIREEYRGEVDPTGAVVRLSLTGSRGLVTCFLWDAAIEAQKKNQWNELEVLVASLTK